MKNVNTKMSAVKKDVIAALVGVPAMAGLFYWMAVIATN